MNNPFKKGDRIVDKISFRLPNWTDCILTVEDTDETHFKTEDGWFPQYGAVYYMKAEDAFIEAIKIQEQKYADAKRRRDEAQVEMSQALFAIDSLNEARKRESGEND
jgi:hypothetical protein